MGHGRQSPMKKKYKRFKLDNTPTTSHRHSRKVPMKGKELPSQPTKREKGRFNMRSKYMRQLKVKTGMEIKRLKNER